MVQELVNRGLATAEEARVAVNKNLVTRALGVDPTVIPDISEEIVSDEDIFLLCSDGLNDVLADGDIELMLTEYQRQLDAAAKRMIDIANERGGPDNISVILVRADRGFKRDQMELRKLRDRA